MTKIVLVAALGGVAVICTTVLVALGSSDISIGIVVSIAVQAMNIVLTSSVEKKVNGHMTALISKIPGGEKPDPEEGGVE